MSHRVGLAIRLELLLAVAVSSGCRDGPAMAPLSAGPPLVEELVPDFPYAAFFLQNTGQDPDTSRFGAYTIEPMSDLLYLGFGTSSPAHKDGALLAVFDGERIRALSPLDEQGFADMTVGAGRLLIPGADPCCEDGWEAGNFYTYDPTYGLTKQRNLPSVLHSWGVWYDTVASAVYVTTGSHTGDFATWTGEIWRSVDVGTSWERIPDREDNVGDFRTYDIIGLADELYAVSSDLTRDCELVSLRAGDLWESALPDATVDCEARLVLFDGRVVTVDVTRRALHSVSVTGEATRIELPITTPSRSYHPLAVAGPYLCAITDDGFVLCSRDLLEWETVARIDQELIAVRYWPRKNWLVVAGRGVDGDLWKLDLNALAEGRTASGVR